MFDFDCDIHSSTPFWASGGSAELRVTSSSLTTSKHEASMSSPTYSFPSVQDRFHAIFWGPPACYMSGLWADGQFDRGVLLQA